MSSALFVQRGFETLGAHGMGDEVIQCQAYVLCAGDELDLELLRFQTEHVRGGKSASFSVAGGPTT